jgi:outer membrane biosynthesis protein TonB
VTDARTVRDHRDRTLLWGLVASLVLHAVLFVPAVRDVFSDVVADALEQRIEPEPVAPPMEFTLVSPPENPTPTEEESRFRSTVSSAASDQDPRDTGANAPHGEGRIPIPDTPGKSGGADGGGKAEVPPLPQEQGDLSEALQRSKWTREVSPQREPSFADETHEYDEPGSARASIGGISLNTTAWDFAPYLLDLKRRIKQKWIPPIAFTALGAIHGYTWIRFRIYPDGRMEGMETIETDGHDSLHKSSANAVKGAAPFRALPADFPEKYLEIEFGFYYLLPGDEDRFFKNGKFIRKEDNGERSQP